MYKFIKYFDFGRYDWLGKYRSRDIISRTCEVINKYSNKTITKDDIIAHVGLQIPLDTFHALYLLNTSHKNNETIDAIIEPLINDKSLRTMTVSNEFVSRVFSINFIKQLVIKLQEEKKESEKNNDKEKQKQVQEIIDSLNSMTNEDENNSDNDNKKHDNKQTKQKSQIKISKDAKKLLNNIVVQSKERAKEKTEQIILYSGLKAGVGHNITIGEALDLQNYTVDLKKLLEIFKGMDFEFSKITKSSIHGNYDNIKYGNDINKLMITSFLLPDELFWYDYATEQLPQIDTKISEIPEFTLLIDKSGSMEDNNKTLWSRAVALVLMKQANKNKVKAKIAFFDSEPTKLYDLRKQHKDVFQLILKVKCNGGTSIDKALKFADESGTGKIILITDGEDEVRYKPNKDLISIMIQGHNETLKQISTKYYDVKPDKNGAITIFENII